jgi:hypothetical protein
MMIVGAALIFGAVIGYLTFAGDPDQFGKFAAMTAILVLGLVFFIAGRIDSRK